MSTYVLGMSPSAPQGPPPGSLEFRRQTLAMARAMRLEYERTGRFPTALRGGLGQIELSQNITFSVGGSTTTISLPELADMAADSVAAIAAAIQDPCTLLDYALNTGAAYLTDWIEELLNNILNDIMGTIGAVAGGELNLQNFQSCADRISGDGGTCSDVTVGAAKFAGKLAGKISAGNYAGAIAEIVKTIIASVVASIIGLLMTQLVQRLKDAILGAINRLGAVCGGNGPPPVGDDGGTPGTGPTPTPPPVPPPGGNNPLPPQGGSGSPPPPPPPPPAAPKPPPPQFLPEKKTPWGTYLLWGGMGLGVALVASKTLTGAWVPPQVARRAAPITSRIKRLKP